MDVPASPAGMEPSGMITIVFVDDEPDALMTLRQLTQGWQHVWDTHFVESGPAALELLDTLNHVDVVVTDMAMPGMDGAELLARIRERSPHTARIILSGRSERQEILRAVGPAHQYLSKPVDIRELAQVVEHARTTSFKVLGDPIRALIGQADRLPSPPGIFQQLVDLMASSDWTVDDVADLLSGDVALTAEILKLVNSSFFGFFGDVNSVNRAVSLLGVDLIRSVVLGSKLFEADDELESWLDLEQLDWRCKSVASGARALALRDRASSETAAAAYLAGMVCEVGLLVMARVPGVCQTAAVAVNVETDLDAERHIFGGNRFEVGTHLLRLWGFNHPIVEAIDLLADPNTHLANGVPWYLFAARRLVLEDGLDPHALAAPEGVVAEVDHALDLLRHCSDFETVSS